MKDEETRLFTVTDLKQYTYCPRIFYYHTCLPDIRPITYKMSAGIDAHETERKRSARRTSSALNVPGAKKHFDVAVVSQTLGLSGQIDEVIESGEELIPVDYKLARQAGTHFHVQLAAYALMLEESAQKPVQHGYIHLIPTRKTVEVRITPTLRSQVHRAVAAMHIIADYEQMPAPTEWRQRCADCEFRRFCNDV
jgi:CRISPR-associated exonuclease Cas4